jgi:hypothetical protein
MQSINIDRSGFCPNGDGDIQSPAEAGKRRGLPYQLLTVVMSWALVLLGFSLPPCSFGATRSPKQPVAPLWSRFEKVLLSTCEYTNALQEANLTAVFTSPQGARRVVNGFWDGGRVWRVRFCPDVPGQWTFTTFCSDPRNAGLDGQTGKFLCTAPAGDSVFRQHGPIRVARDHTHFEHIDGTPFFWLADSVGSGAILSGPKDWLRYASIRSSQLFNVSLWSVSLGENYEHESALAGFPERIGINPKFFQYLDSKVETLSSEGILSAIRPLPGADSGLGAKALPEDQAALLIRYLLARWGAEPVVWVMGSDDAGAEVGRWSKICNGSITNSVHAPVIFYAGRSANVAEELRNEAWLDGLGLDVSAVPSDRASARPHETTAEFDLPVVLFIPRENGVIPLTHERVKPDDVRHAVYQSLFLRPPAGVTYAAQGVVNWDTTADNTPAAALGAGMPLWEKALFMRGAKQMRCLANLMNSIDFWRLRPRPEAVTLQASQPADETHAVAASTPAKDLTLVYLPQPNPVDVSLQAMPASPLISWLEPRQGFTRSAVAVVSGSVCQFPPPGEGDWVLVIKSSK